MFKIPAHNLKLLPVLLLSLSLSSFYLINPNQVWAGNSIYPIGPICTVRKGPDSFGNYINAPVPCDWTCAGNLECWGNDYEGPINHNGDGVSQKFTNQGNIYKTFTIGSNQTVNIKFWVYSGYPNASCVLGIEDGTGGGWQWWSYNTSLDGAGWHLFDVTRDTTSSDINVMAANNGGGNCYFDDFQMNWTPKAPPYSQTAYITSPPYLQSQYQVTPTPIPYFQSNYSATPPPGSYSQSGYGSNSYAQSSYSPPYSQNAYGCIGYTGPWWCGISTGANCPCGGRYFTCINGADTPCECYSCTPYSQSSYGGGGYAQGSYYAEGDYYSQGSYYSQSTYKSFLKTENGDVHSDK